MKKGISFKIFLLLILCFCLSACKACQKTKAGKSTQKTIKVSAIREKFESDNLRLENMRTILDRDIYSYYHSKKGYSISDEVLMKKSVDEVIADATNLKEFAQKCLKQTQKIRELTGSAAKFSDHINYAEEKLIEFKAIKNSIK